MSPALKTVLDWKRKRGYNAEAMPADPTASYSTEFVDWALTRGGLWVSPGEPDLLFDPAISKEAAALRETASHWTASTHGIMVEAGVVASEQINASAALVNGKYFVAINGAMVVYLYGQCLAAVRRVEWPLSAESRDRFSITAHAAVAVARFHEFGHVVNGHLDYLQSLGQKALSGLDNQTLEYDADSYAAQQLFTQLTGARVDGRREDHSQILQWPDSNRIGKQAQQMNILGAAMYLYFDTIVRFSGGLKPGWESDFTLAGRDRYPPLEARVHGMFATVTTYLQSFGLSVEQRQEAIRSIVDGVLEMATNLGERGERLQKLLRPIGPAQAYLKMLEENWNAKIRPALEPFARTRLAGSPFDASRHK